MLLGLAGCRGTRLFRWNYVAWNHKHLFGEMSAPPPPPPPLAMAGDLGGAIGPGIVGNISQSAGDDIRKGVLAGCIFPLVLVILTFVISKNVNKNRQE